MKLLGIDTATNVLAVALTDGKTLISESRVNMKKAHAEKLLVTVDRLLHEVSISLKELDGIAISIGPGSFTGLRIGLATVKGIAFAEDLPIVAVPTLDALVWQARYSAYPICPLVKAQATEAYTALFTFEQGRLKSKSEYQLVKLENLEKFIKKKTYVLNFGMKDLKDYVTDNLKNIIQLMPEDFCLASGYAVAMLGYDKLIKNETENIEQLVPFYLKDFKAKKKRGL